MEYQVWFAKVALTNHKYFIPLKYWIQPSKVLWLAVGNLCSLQENVGENFQRPVHVKINCDIRKAILDTEGRFSKTIKYNNLLWKKYSNSGTI